MNDNDDRKEAIALIGVAFNNFRESQAQLYVKLLEDIPGELVKKSVVVLIKSSKFPPTIAEIREKSEQIYSMAKGIQAPDAGRAWGEVQKAISKYGSYRTPKFDDSLTEEAVKRFGWNELCTSEDPVSVMRGQFFKIYEMLAQGKRAERKIKLALGDGKVQELIAGVSERRKIK